MRNPSRRLLVPALIFVVCAGIYCATLGERRTGTSSQPHYVYLADSFLHGQLAVRATKPPTDNDWARFGGKIYVSFPPFPGVVIMPLVAVWGVKTWDSLFWSVVAGLGPALLYVLLRRLREQGMSERTVRDDLLLTLLFAVGSVFYFVAVQGTVWFAAHVVAVSLIALYVLCALRAAHPLWAGLFLGLQFMTRGPTALLLGAFFACEALLHSQRAQADGPATLRSLLGGADLGALAKKVALFALPLIAIGGLAMAFNEARFNDPFEFGHSLLEIRWRSRIEKWGLFNYHYLGRNMAVMLTSLPWLTSASPYVMIGRHGLALWVTTPQLLLVLWPKRSSFTMFGLGLAAGLTALANLLYQNSGWIQFGYRFSLDYAVLLFALLALGGRKFGWRFMALTVLAIAINLFGAITFDRAQRFYDKDSTQRVIHQPD
jgi:hypothetical protein